MEPAPPLEIQFVHRRLKPLAGAPDLRSPPGADDAVLAAFKRRTRLSRSLFVVSGAAVIAWGTQRAGIALPQALCLFFGALPLLWVGGWVAGSLLEVRRVARRGAAAAQGFSLRFEAGRGESVELFVEEQVKVALAPDALVVTRDGNESRHDWGGVSLHRLVPDSTQLGFTSGPGPQYEHLELPASAFPTPEAFDEFCLAIQRRAWAAQRLAFTNRRA